MNIHEGTYDFHMSWPLHVCLRPTRRMLVFIAYAQNPNLNDHVDVASGT